MPPQLARFAARKRSPRCKPREWREAIKRDQDVPPPVEMRISILCRNRSHLRSSPSQVFPVHLKTKTRTALPVRTRRHK